MAEPLYHDALADELVVQEVILDSLQGEHFDGAEQERQEARREIARLRALLSQPPGPAQTPNRDSSCDGDGRDDAQAQSRHSLPTSTTPTARLSASVEPASSRRSSAAFSTRTLRMDNDIWRSPGARSLPSRKRVNGFATPQDSASSVIDIIDLTGDDVDYDATCIAQHIKEEKTRAGDETGVWLSSFRAKEILLQSSRLLRLQDGREQSVSHRLRACMAPRTPALPSSGSVSLLDAIDKPSMLDYANQLDAEGNPFADRLSSFLDHAYHDPNSLYHHQELALSWMKKMEEGTNKGGILADDMGLGKTISTLALMLARPAVGRPKTNLIIGPLSLVRQWEEEISKKTKLSHRMSVFVYHNTKAMTDDLLRYDVVLTTYGTIAQELKRLEKFMEDNADRNIDLNDRANALKFPLLHPTKAVFHRVVLDEAQCIKNRKTKTAKACHALKSTYRWCLTGTPMMNGVLELFSLVQFLHIKPYCVWENFRQAFGILCGLKGDARASP
ncbi:putative ATP-dependent helicase [Hirsutella rhossiliensis]|uniref:ATP-dependent helicase n=1 Tax=Hirsutella rhossiliensis TaxID=111463 RepID=A0A9P8SBY9_9HYPO|nr:putative ATP-dependent helicase [Hirsutella rhossiliensis]KAH0957048.1 putative ATP-dependent helicase [Hirsutella rhossiliensis]